MSGQFFGRWFVSTVMVAVACWCILIFVLFKDESFSMIFGFCTLSGNPSEFAIGAMKENFLYGFFLYFYLNWFIVSFVLGFGLAFLDKDKIK